MGPSPAKRLKSDRDEAEVKVTHRGNGNPIRVELGGLCSGGGGSREDVRTAGEGCAAQRKDTGEFQKKAAAVRRSRVCVAEDSDVQYSTQLVISLFVNTMVTA